MHRFLLWGKVMTARHPSRRVSLVPLDEAAKAIWMESSTSSFSLRHTQRVKRGGKERRVCIEEDRRPRSEENTHLTCLFVPSAPEILQATPSFPFRSTLRRSETYGDKVQQGKEVVQKESPEECNRRDHLLPLPMP